MHQHDTRRARPTWAASWLVAACLLAASATTFGADEVGKAPAPAWVRPIPVPVDATVPVSRISDGAYYLLSDSQARIEKGGKVVFQHYAIKAVAESGVESSANIQVGFDPSYQRLTLHAIRVLRDGRAIDKLASAAVQVLQREKDLETLIFDGSKTASVVLDDVRIGDVVEYSFSVAGANPVFGDRAFGGYALQFGVPVERLVARLLVPEDREIQVRTRNGARAPTQSTADGFRHYEIDLHRVPGRMVEKDAPGWFDPYPALEWSEFADWSAVARWAVPLYRTPSDPGPAIRAQVEAIRRAGLAPAEQVAAALRFVQREVRYLGVEIGPGSHAPRPPQVVLDRRFGDCKDKTLLTVTLLEALGISARPALVDTERLRGIAAQPPNPGAFNHVIVLATVAGRRYWIDPTRPTQQGPLASLFQPDFGLALVVDPATTALTTMGTATPASQSRTVRAVFDARAGLDKPVGYTITTTARGRSAEGLRRTLANANRDDLQKDYLNYYAGYYPGVSVVAPMTVSEDASGNAITTVERYAIADFWPRGEPATHREAEIYAADMEDMLKQSPSSIRQSPLEINHPMDFTHSTEVLLPEAWTIEADHTRVEDPAFVFERTVTPGERRVLLTDRYRSRADHVPAARVRAHADNLKKARAALGFQLIKDEPGVASFQGFDFNPTIALLAALLAAIFAGVALRLHRYDPAPRPLPSEPLEGLGGWLVVVGLIVCLGPLVSLASVLELLPSLGNAEWASLTLPGGDRYHPLWAPILLSSLASQLGLLVASCLALPLFFGKRRSFPPVLFGILLLDAASDGLALALLAQLPDGAAAEDSTDWTPFAVAIVRLALWGSYLRLSVRVKSTFVRGWREPLPAPRVASAPALAPAPAELPDPALT